MPNPVPRKYTVQLGPTFTPETAGELAAWAERRGKSVSEITREATERGLIHLRRAWERETGGLPSHERVTALVAEAAERGEKQAARRTRSDRARRVDATG